MNPLDYSRSPGSWDSQTWLMNLDFAVVGLPVDNVLHHDYYNLVEVQVHLLVFVLASEVQD